MKSLVRTFALSAAAASKRPVVATDSTGNQRTFRFKKAYLLLALGLLAPSRALPPRRHPTASR
jgi:hypothetical protein